jgi:hypothetical protein
VLEVVEVMELVESGGGSRGREVELNKKAHSSVLPRIDQVKEQSFYRREESECKSSISATEESK